MKEPTRIFNKLTLRLSANIKCVLETVGVSSVFEHAVSQSADFHERSYCSLDGRS